MPHFAMMTKQGSDMLGVSATQPQMTLGELGLKAAAVVSTCTSLKFAVELQGEIVITAWSLHEL